MVAGFGDAPRRGGVEPPLEHVALDDQRTGDGSFTSTLLARSDVDQESSGLVLRRRLTRVNPVQAGPGGGQQLIDGHRAGLRHDATPPGDPVTRRGAACGP